MEVRRWLAWAPAALFFRIRHEHPTSLTPSFWEILPGCCGKSVFGIGMMPIPNKHYASLAGGVGMNRIGSQKV